VNIRIKVRFRAIAKPRTRARATFKSNSTDIVRISVRFSINVYG
jgi:hypothetical protein